MSSVTSVQKAVCSRKKMERNPFKVPDDSDLFQLRNAEKTQRKLEYRRELSLPVHEKKTFSGRMKARQLELRKELRADLDEDDESTTNTTSKVQLLQNIPASKLFMFKSHNIDKESIREFIDKKREMFYLEHALVVKKEKIEELEKIASQEEKKLANAEKLLEEDAALFDEFLKESDKNSVDAIKIAEQETKTKLEKVVEIKKANAKMLAIKSEISKYEDTLEENKLYRDFLFKLSPPEWQEQQRVKQKLSVKSDSTITKKDTEGMNQETDRGKKTPQSDRDTGKEKKSSSSSQELLNIHKTRSSLRQSVMSPESGKISPASETDSLEYEEEPELYFTDPQQLLDLLNELEEQNLFLIQNTQETEEGLEEFRQSMEQTRKNMDHEANQLKHMIDVMTETIEKEKERNAELELKIQLYNYGKYKTDEESTLTVLSQKVEDVYRNCVCDSEANLSTLQMLTAIESRVGELLDSMETIPADRLVMAEKAKEKERRIKLREEKINLQKQHQEERVKKSLERAQADIKKKCGRKLMPRSQPPVRKLKNKEDSEIMDQNKDEYLYFFT